MGEGVVYCLGMDQWENEGGAMDRAEWAQAQIDQLEAQVRGISRDRDDWRERYHQLESRLNAARLIGVELAALLSDIHPDPAGGYE